MRSNLHCGMVALVFAGALAFGETWDWIGRLWNSVDVLQSVHGAAGDCGLEIDPDGKPRCVVPQAPPPCEDCGLEIDPNG